MEVKFTPTAKPSTTETVTYERTRPIVLGERTNLWGTKTNITQAPSNIFTFSKYLIKKCNSIFNR